MPRRSIGGPLAIGIVSMVLVLALGVGWQILVWRDDADAAPGMSTFDMILFGFGTLFFLMVFAGLVWLCVKLVLEMRLSQSQRAFIDAVTHELKTPLSSFRLGLETLDRHELPPEKRAEFLGRMGEDLDRLEYTVTQVLAAARAEDGRPRRADRKSVDLRSVLEENVRELRERHGLGEEAVLLDRSRPLRVRGDEAELGVIFRNLLENAVKYSEEPIAVCVRVASNGEGRVEVDIADRGIGIPAGELRKIFQRFYRAGRDVQRTATGLGLGLFIVRNLVKRQGGRVVARSGGSGTGSRFVVTLRAAPPAA